MRLFDNISQINAYEYLNFDCRDTKIKSYGSFNTNLYKDIKNESDFVELYNEIFQSQLASVLKPIIIKLGQH